MALDQIKKRLEVLQADAEDLTCLTFVLKDEDHTLGNALRYIIMQNPQVEYCGYATPHPSENKINLRIQTYGVPAADVFKKGLEDLQNICNTVTETFKESLKQYKNTSFEETMEN